MGNLANQPLIHVLLVVAALFAFIRLSGIGALAKHYPSTTRPTGQRFYFAWGTINGITWVRSLDITVSRDGLYLALILPFRPFASATFLKWSDVTVSQDNPYFVDRALVSAPNANVTISVSGRLAKAVLAASSHNPSAA
jgi:hypothetical protein